MYRLRKERKSKARINGAKNFSVSFNFLKIKWIIEMIKFFF